MRVLLPLLWTIAGCVSTGTVSSTLVKPDRLAQTYGVHCRQADQSCIVTAQLRLGDHKGDTVALTAPSRILINGKAPIFVDARTTNTVLDAMSMLTVLPVFKLYKSGSFYHRTDRHEARTTFELTDDAGRTSRTHMESPGFAPAPKERDPRLAVFRLEGPPLPGESVTCFVTHDPGPREVSRFTTASPAEGGYRCDFAATEPWGKTFRLKVLRSRSGEHRDEAGRPVKTFASTELVVEGSLAAGKGS